MYRLINRNADEIIKWILPDKFYEELLVGVTAEAIQSQAYQLKFRKYWGMNAAQLSAGFHQTYFARLAEALKTPMTIEPLAATLYEASVRKDGRKSIQFSFATKLLHMANPSLPIYDSYVAQFYFFEPPFYGEFAERLPRMVGFYRFLVDEYARILKHALLAEAIGEFRRADIADCWTDERIIDYLIWGAVKLLREQKLSCN
jgi:hypothetical protein